MRILLTGGGTGGHITPILAVAHELKKLDPECHVIYVGERRGKFSHLLTGQNDIDEVRTIFAGKFRRYYGESWLVRLLDIKTNLLNIRDMFYFFLGTLQSWFLLRKLRPDVVFLKGSFVGVPVGIAAHWRHSAIITHDSDSMPGIANRFVGRWALWHATGMPAEFYDYPKDRTKYIGVLVGANYQNVTPQLQADYKKQLNIPESSKTLLITGGSGGAAKINVAMRQLMPQLLEKYPDLYIVHQVGKGKAGIYTDYSHDRLHVAELLQPLYVYSGASDIVVSRAGANTIAELGVQSKPCIIIPNPLLTGGHQLKNAEYLDQQGAAVIIDEESLSDDSSQLKQAINDLLDNPTKRQDLGLKLHEITIPDAANQLAMILLETAKTNQYVQKKENPAQ